MEAEGLGQGCEKLSMLVRGRGHKAASSELLHAELGPQPLASDTRAWARVLTHVVALAYKNRLAQCLKATFTTIEDALVLVKRLCVLDSSTLNGQIQRSNSAQQATFSEDGTLQQHRFCCRLCHGCPPRGCVWARLYLQDVRPMQPLRGPT